MKDTKLESSHYIYCGHCAGLVCVYGNPDDDAPDAAAALWQRARVAGADSPDMAVDTPALPLDSLVPAVIATDTVGDDSLLVVLAAPALRAK